MCSRRNKKKRRRRKELDLIERYLPGAFSSSHAHSRYQGTHTELRGCQMWFLFHPDVCCQLWKWRKTLTCICKTPNPNPPPLFSLLFRADTLYLLISAFCFSSSNFILFIYSFFVWLLLSESGPLRTVCGFDWSIPYLILRVSKECSRLQEGNA